VAKLNNAGADLSKELIKWYEKKASEKSPAGRFFKLFEHGRATNTIWAISAMELSAYLKENKITHSHFVALT